MPHECKCYLFIRKYFRTVFPEHVIKTMLSKFLRVHYNKFICTVRFVDICQCCGSGSVFFGASWIRIRIHLSSSKNIQNNLDIYGTVLFSDFFMTLSLKNYVNVLTESKKQKNLDKGVLKVNDENSLIRFRIRTKMSRIRNTDVSGMIAKKVADPWRIWIQSHRLDPDPVYF